MITPFRLQRALSAFIRALNLVLGTETDEATLGESELSLFQVESWTEANLDISQQKKSYQIVFCLQKTWQMLLGAHLIIITDHEVLIFLNNCGLLNSRITCWLLGIQEYCFEIWHCSVKYNVMVDFLTRKPCDYPEQSHTNNTDLTISTTCKTVSLKFIENIKKLPQLQRDDSKRKQLINELNENISTTDQLQPPTTKSTMYCYYRN